MVIKIKCRQLSDGALELELRLEEKPRPVIDTEGVELYEPRPLAKCGQVIELRRRAS
jgi:hypothetical protein